MIAHLKKEIILRSSYGIIAAKNPRMTLSHDCQDRARQSTEVMFAPLTQEPQVRIPTLAVSDMDFLEQCLKKVLL